MEAKSTTETEAKPAEAATPQAPAVDVTTILRRDNEEYQLVKKLPKRFPTRFNDVYVTNKTDFKAQLKKCESILLGLAKAADKAVSAQSSTELVLHAIGPAINRAINLALSLQSKRPNLVVNCYTATMVLEDDLIPLMDHLEVTFQHRHLSAIHIKIHSKE